MNYELAGLPIDDSIDQLAIADFVVIIGVVGGVLEMPLDLAGVRIEGKQAVAVEVVARTLLGVELWRRIAGAPVD